MRDKTIPTREDARREMRLAVSEKKARETQAIFDAVVSFGDTTPTSSVLDVGCGGGRVTRLFEGYLAPSGSYTGLDVRSELIRELQSTVGSKYPNFRFVAANVQNGMYNPHGKYPASGYQLPFQDETFDLVFLYSVFTHMMPKEVEHYLSQIARILKRGKRCVTTYFLINEAALARIERGNLKHLKHPFPHNMGVHRVDSLASPADAVAFDEAYIRSLYKGRGLSIVEPIGYGTWCRHEGFYNRAIPQDVIVAAKE